MSTIVVDDDIKCWHKIAAYLSDEDWFIQFQTLLNIRSASRRLNTIVFSQEYIDNYLKTKLLIKRKREILKKCFFKRTKELLTRGNPDQIEKFLCHKYCLVIPQFYERVKKLLPYSVKNTTDPQIIDRLLSITLDGQRLSFSNTNLIRTIVHANERANKDVLIIILPHLLKLFDVENDPDPAQKITEAVKRGEKLNFDECYDMVLHNQIEKNDKDNADFTEQIIKLEPKLLLPLIQPKKQSLIIPEGTLINLRHSEIKSCEEWTADLIAFKYNDRQFRETEAVHWYNEGLYHYEDGTTSNFYEVIVRSIASEMPCSFTRVALTEELFSLPVEQQPWFFGHVHGDRYYACEPGYIGLYTRMHRTPDSNTMLLTSDGHRITIHVSSGVHHSSLYGKSIDPSDLRKIVAENQILFGFYNHGVVKDLEVYHFYKKLIEGDWQEAKQFWESQKIDLAKFYSQPHPANEYLHYAASLKSEVINWLLEVFKDKSLGPDFLYNAYRKKVFTMDELAGFSLRGATCDSPFLCDMMENKNANIQHLKTFYKNCTRHYYERNEFQELLMNAWRFKSIDRTRSTLVWLAWKFGNEDNFFKHLPKEIICEILKYDEPEWFELGEEMLTRRKKNPKAYVNENGADLRFYIQTDDFMTLSFIWKNASNLPKGGMQAALVELLRIEHFDYVTTRHQLLVYIQRFARWIKNSFVGPWSVPQDIFAYNKAVAYCFRDGSAFETLVDLVNLLGRNYTTSQKLDGVPITWLAVAAKNRKATKFLHDNGYLMKSYDGASLEDYLCRNDAANMIDFVRDLPNGK